MEQNIDFHQKPNFAVKNIENNEKLCSNTIEGNNSATLPEKKISKNALRKKQRWQNIKEKNRETRRERKLSKKSKKEKERASNIESHVAEASSHISKKDRIKIERERLLSILNNSTNACHNENTLPVLNVCIDLQYGDKMSDKELSHLASQLRRTYGANKSCEQPAMISLVSLDENERTYRMCCEKNDGFQNYIWRRTAKPLVDEYSSVIDKLVYLTPDSPTTLESLARDKIYVIGGLVDDSVQKNITYSYATENKIATAKLPIKEQCPKNRNGSYTFKQTLAINQVFDILQKFDVVKDWGIALTAGVPKRMGYLSKKE